MNRIEQLKEEVIVLKKELSLNKKELKLLEKELHDKLILLPNLPHPSVPDNTEIIRDFWGEGVSEKQWKENFAKQVKRSV